MKVRDVIKLIEADGWYLVVTKGSHRQYKHAQKTGRVTIAGHKRRNGSRNFEQRFEAGAIEKHEK